MRQFNKSRGVDLGRTAPTSVARAGFPLVTPVGRRAGAKDRLWARSRDLRSSPGGSPDRV